jgi:hypothetical protein
MLRHQWSGGRQRLCVRVVDDKGGQDDEGVVGVVVGGVAIDTA